MGNPLLLVLKGLHKTQSLILGREKQADEVEVEDTAGAETNNSSSAHKRPTQDANAVAVVNVTNGDTQSAREGRKLRSNVTHTNPDATLFRFDMNLSAINYSIPTKLEPAARSLVSVGKTKNQLKSQRFASIDLPRFDYSSVVTGAPTASNGTVSNVTVSNGGAKRRHVHALDDSIYAVHHRRMERDEKRLHNIEREKNALEMDRLAAYYRDLKDEQTWRRVMTQIVALDDPSDEKELVAKRRLVVAELDTCFLRYNEWKRKMNEQRWRVAGSESSESTSTTTTTTTATTKPKKRASLVALSTGLAAPSPKRPRKSSLPAAPEKELTSFFSPSDKARYVKFDQLIRRDHRNQLAFGCPLPYLSLKEFQLPSLERIGHIY